MNRSSIVAVLLLAFATSGYGASGVLTVFDDDARNGFTDCSSGFVSFHDTDVVHTGSFSIEAENDSNAQVCLAAPAAYSVSSDFDGISFWINRQADATSEITLYLRGETDDFGATLTELYGAPIPADTWVHIQVSFSSPLFEFHRDAATFTEIHFRSSLGFSNLYFLDDISLIGADLFKDGFDR